MSCPAPPYTLAPLRTKWLCCCGWKGVKGVRVPQGRQVSPTPLNREEGVRDGETNMVDRGIPCDSILTGGRDAMPNGSYIETLLVFTDLKPLDMIGTRRQS